MYLADISHLPVIINQRKGQPMYTSSTCHLPIANAKASVCKPYLPVIYQIPKGQPVQTLSTCHFKDRFSVKIEVIMLACVMLKRHLAAVLDNLLT